MIWYGGLRNKFTRLTGTTTHFHITGGVKVRLTPVVEVSQQFPVYGAVHKVIDAPVRDAWYGAMLRRIVPPRLFTTMGAKLNHAQIATDLPSLTLETTGRRIIFSTPRLSYDISPYNSSDVYKVIGGGTHSISGSILTFDVLPTENIIVIPNTRLQMHADEIRAVRVINSEPKKYDYSNITIANGAQYALAETGPWVSSLTVTDRFYMKAPSMVDEGSDFTRDITLSATITPRG